MIGKMMFHFDFFCLVVVMCAVTTQPLWSGLRLASENDKGVNFR